MQHKHRLAHTASLKGKHVDGMVKASSSSGLQPIKTKKAAEAAAKAKTASAKRAKAKPAKRTVQKSKTLHRKVVKKPAADEAKTPKVSKASSYHPNERLERAKSTEKHPAVSRHHSVKTKVEPKVVPIKPKHHAAHAAPAPVQSPSAYKPKAPKASAPSVMEKQVEKATAHNSHTRETTPKKGLLHKLATPAGLLPVFVTTMAIAGFLVYQNIPSISMRVAANRAGFNARLPESPIGFGVDGPVVVDGGRVSVRFRSNTDTRNATLHQQPSNLDTDSLRLGFLEQNDIEYQTYSRNGSTIFIYGDSQATWLNQGVWFTLEGESRLSPAQILDLASSI